MTSGIILYSRTFGINKSIRQILTWLPMVGLGWFFAIGGNPIDMPLMFGLITAPIVIGLLFQLFENVCQRVYKRAFYLHALGAREMNGLGLRSENRHYEGMDMIFSMALILMWIGWPILFVGMIRLI